MLRTMAVRPAALPTSTRLSRVQSRPNLTFWLLFVVANLLLFLPRYLLNADSERLLPAQLWDGGLWMGLSQLLVWRANLDPFRLCIEFCALVALWVTVPFLRGRVLRALIVGLYMLTLLYYSYEAVMASIWFLDANFFREYYLARDGLPFLLGQLHAGWWIYVLAGTAFVALCVLLVLLINAMLASGSAARFRRGGRVGVGVVGSGALAALLLFGPYTAQAEMVTSSLGWKLAQNVGESYAMRDSVAQYDDREQLAAYDYSNEKLLRKPNIYLIFVESYGSVLYQRPHFVADYRAVLAEVEGQLSDAGWHSRSTMSESPMWGGGSWMAYSSVLFGTRMDNHPQYLSLFERYQIEEYPTLGRTLHDQGYESVWVASIIREISDGEWERHRRFMGADQHIRYRALDYVGAQYGWGPAAPDQYVLNYANQMAQAATDKPIFFATITQNSHYPWLPLPEFVEDWRTLNQPPAPQGEGSSEDPTEVAVEEKRANYLQAIDYQLRTLADFIINSGDEESLFILVGDHQPPQVSRRSDGWLTPMHVISRDAALVDAFAEYGFGPGLEIPSLELRDNELRLRHEGIYSLLMRVLLQEYGADPTDPPDYLPAGAASPALPADSQ